VYPQMWVRERTSDCAARSSGLSSLGALSGELCDSDHAVRGPLSRPRRAVAIDRSRQSHRTVLDRNPDLGSVYGGIPFELI